MWTVGGGRMGGIVILITSSYWSLVLAGSWLRAGRMAAFNPYKVPMMSVLLFSQLGTRKVRYSEVKWHIQDFWERQSTADPEHSWRILLGVPRTRGPPCSFRGLIPRAVFAEHILERGGNISPWIRRRLFIPRIMKVMIPPPQGSSPIM